MHLLEQIFRQARQGNLPDTVLGGWTFSQFGSSTKDKCIAIRPSDPKVPTYIFCVEDIESPTHLRILVNQIEKQGSL